MPISDPNDLMYGTRGNYSGDVMVVGEAWGKNEEDHKLPFVGQSGLELEKMLTEGGIDPARCLFTNVIPRRPARNDFKQFLIQTQPARKLKLQPFKGVYPTKDLLLGITRIIDQIKAFKPKLIITVGNWSLWALTDYYKISDDKGYKVAGGVDTFRGSQYYTEVTYDGQGGGEAIPLLPTYHPAAILRSWSWRHIAVQDFRRANRFLTHGVPWHDTRELNWIIEPSPRETRDWVDEFYADNERDDDLELTLDLETYARQIHIFGVKNPRTGSCLCVPFMHVSADGSRPVYSVDDFTSIGGDLRRLLTHPRVGLVGQNIIYDIQYLRRFFHYTPKVVFDTMVAQHLCFINERKGLDFISSIYCRYYRYWKDDRKVSLANESTRQGCEYNCDDLEYTQENRLVLGGIIKQMKKEHLFEDKLELLHILFDMMNFGVPISMSERGQQAVEILDKIMEVTCWLEGAVPNDLKPEGKKGSAPWYNSTKKLQEMLYDTLGIKPIYDTKSGNPTLAKEALGTIAYNNPGIAPLLNTIAVLRSYGVFKSTFLDSKIDGDNHVRCAYNPCGTTTNRLSSSENVFDTGMNLTNIPRERNELTFFNAIEELT